MVFTTGKTERAGQQCLPCLSLIRPLQLYQIKAAICHTYRMVFTTGKAGGAGQQCGPYLEFNGGGRRCVGKRDGLPLLAGGPCRLLAGRVLQDADRPLRRVGQVLQGPGGTTRARTNCRTTCVAKGRHEHIRSDQPVPYTLCQVVQVAHISPRTSSGIHKS